MSAEMWAAGAAVLSSAITSFVVWLKARSATEATNELENKKLDIEKADQLAEATQRLMENLRKDLERMEMKDAEMSRLLENERAFSVGLGQQNRELTKANNGLRFRVKMLERQIKELRGE